MAAYFLLYVTGTISSIKGSDIQNLAVSDAGAAIQGRVIVRSNGAPGSAPAIRIRGTGTSNNSDPLVIIDGVPAIRFLGRDNFR